MQAYLYTLEDCQSCEVARTLAISKGYNLTEVPIDNPLLELGVQLLFNDNKVYAPVVVIPGEAIYILTQDIPQRLVKVVGLEV